MCGRFFKQDVSLKSYPAEGPAEDKVGLCYCHLNLKMPRSFLFCPLEKKSSWRKGDASPARPWEGADITCLWSWAFNNKLYYQSGKKNRSFVWGQGRDYVCPPTSPPRRGIPRGQMQDSGFWKERMFSSTACKGRRWCVKSKDEHQDRSYDKTTPIKDHPRLWVCAVEHGNR